MRLLSTFCTMAFGDLLKLLSEFKYAYSGWLFVLNLLVVRLIISLIPSWRLESLASTLTARVSLVVTAFSLIVNEFVPSP